MAKQIVSYNGKNYEVIKKTEFRGRTYYKLATIETKVSEILIGKKIEGAELVTITSAE